MLGKSQKFARPLLLLLSVLLVAFSGAADERPPALPDQPHYAIEHFGERFGLSAITVISMDQDKQGFLWIGSQTGVYRYDGLHVTAYGLADGLPGLHTKQLLIAPDGKVWVRVRKGLARLEGPRFAPVTIPAEAGKLTSDVQSFAVDAAGKLYVIVDKGLLILDVRTREFRVLTAADGLPSSCVEAVVRAPDDSIWLAAAGHLARFNPKDWKLEILPMPILPADRVAALVPDVRGRMWIRTQSHVATLNLEASGPRQLVFHDEGIPPANSDGIPVVDRHGDLMLPTASGLYRWHGDRWQVISRASGLTSNALFSALEDREGTIWVGLAGAGLDRWPGSSQWSGWIDDGGLPDSLVLAVVRDPRGRLWVGTNSGLSMWDDANHRWKVWNNANSPVGGVRRLAIAKDGELWVLCPAASLVWIDASLDNPVPVAVATGKDVASISTIGAAPDGAVWWNGDKSIHIAHRQNSSFKLDEMAVPKEFQGTTTSISLSPRGVLWGGGPNGLSRFDGARWQRFGAADGLLDTNVYSLAAVSDNEAWAGYSDQNAATHVRIDAQRRLQAQHISKAACLLGVDRSGNTWLEMGNSLGRLSPDGQLRNFTRSDGLLWDDTNCGAFWQESDGTLLIGTSHGLARYDPRQEELPRAPPSVVLTGAEFAGDDSFTKINPRVPYDQAWFSVQFSAMTFRDPDQVTCRYRLKGLEREFSETSLREVRYSALQPGNYTFEVACGSQDVGWSAKPAQYSFTVLAPWWRTTWARTAGIVLVGLLILALIHFRTRRLESDRRRLETAVEERSSELARVNRELQEASLTDPLTGVRNRRFFYTTIAADANQATRAYFADQSSYSRDHRDIMFYLIDLDHFKLINDAYGHDAGDEVLVECARRLSLIVRKSDFLIRWGGEEFLIVCRAAERKDAAIVAEKILSAIAEEPFTIAGGKKVNRSCSVGWAPFPWDPALAPLTVDEVLKMADRGLYRAKDRGRNHAIGMLPMEFAEVPVAAGGGEDKEEESSLSVREVVSPGPGW